MPSIPRAPLVCLIAWAALVLLATAIGDVGSTCLFRRATGVPCPTCGATRGTLDLLAGRPGGAWRANPLFFGVIAATTLLLTFRFTTGRRVHFGLSRRERRVVGLVAVIAIIGGWAYTIGTIP